MHFANNQHGWTPGSGAMASPEKIKCAGSDKGAVPRMEPLRAPQKALTS